MDKNFKESSREKEILIEFWGKEKESNHMEGFWAVGRKWECERFPVAGSLKVFWNQGNGTFTVKLFVLLWFKHPPPLQSEVRPFYVRVLGQRQGVPCEGGYGAKTIGEGRKTRMCWKFQQNPQIGIKTWQWNSKPELCRRKYYLGTILFSLQDVG